MEVREGVPCVPLQFNHCHLLFGPSGFKRQMPFIENPKYAAWINKEITIVATERHGKIEKPGKL